MRKKRQLKKRSDKLPEKFTAAERRAYDWLYEFGVRAWVVDLLTKEVRSAWSRYASLVHFAKVMGMNEEGTEQ